MRSVAGALLRAVPLLADRRVVALLALPVAGAVILWAALAIILWAPIRDRIAVALAGGGLSGGYGFLADAGGNVGAFVVLTLSSGVLALAAIAMFAGPVFTRAVESNYYPALERRHGGTFAGSFANALVALAVFVPLWILSLPFALVPPVGIALTLVLNAWLNQRLFRYDALADHASVEERTRIVRARRGQFIALGLVLAPLSFVPIVNLIAPIFAGLAFTCMALGALAELRGAGSSE